MTQKIDCFLSCHNASEMTHTVKQLEESTLVRRVFLLENQPLQSDCVLMNVAEQAVADFVLLTLKPQPLNLGKGALERLMLAFAPPRESTISAFSRSE